MFCMINPHNRLRSGLGFAFCLLLINFRSSLMLQAEEFNYDESKVPPYTLPDLLQCEDGTVVDSAVVWTTKRRPELLRMFEEHVFGTLPAGKIPLRTKVRSSVPDALDGKALRREVTVFFSDDDSGPQMELLIYTPVNATEPVPAFLGYNFNGNHAVEKDPRIHLTDSWMRNNQEQGIEDNKRQSRFPDRPRRRCSIRSRAFRGSPRFLPGQMWSRCSDPTGSAGTSRCLATRGRSCREGSRR